MSTCMLACAHCGGTARFRIATLERAVGYCDEACQRAHWRSLDAEARAALSIVEVQRVDLACAQLTKEDMGRATWVFLHAMARTLDADAPCPSGVAAITEALRAVYPCEMCREHYDEMLARTPARYESGRAYRRWLCERHNEVNRELGKPCWPCDDAERSATRCAET